MTFMANFCISSIAEMYHLYIVYCFGYGLEVNREPQMIDPNGPKTRQRSQAPKFAL